MTPAFPFSALVGQELLKRALLLGVIQPGLGGVLIRGTKGVAKSTAVRALATLLPRLETVAGCPFQRRPGETIADWPLPQDAQTVSRTVPLIELPLGATEDRVLGTLHLERALRGERVFEPGLLAAANRGILYIDEVNLLPDHLVDILLDAAAGGMHRIERDGLSLSHPARFLLVGTMNPEEGELRPQLLDRFGLVADATDLGDAADRAEAVRRRLAYDGDPARFVAAWQAADVAEADRVVRAQDLLPEVRIADELLEVVSKRCLAERVEGLRADLTVCKAACAWAAYHGRREVQADDIDAVAELALAHRRTPPPPQGGGGKGEGGRKNGEQPENGGPGSPTRQHGRPIAGAGESVDSSAGVFTAQVKPALRHATDSGRWRDGQTKHSTFRHGDARAHHADGAGVAWAATVRAAALHQRGRGWSAGRLLLHGDDLRFWPRRGPGGCLLLFVVDTSGSMAAWQRMRQTKAAILALLVQAYQHRDQVAILAFRGEGSELVLPPTRGLAAAQQALDELPAGGTTPLAHGLGAACRFIRRQQRRCRDQSIWTVILTDGRANCGTADPWQEGLAQARALTATGSDCLVVDTETGWPRFGQVAELSQVMNAACIPLEQVLGKARTTSLSSAS
jgi:magnesium chelatase subunit D